MGLEVVVKKKRNEEKNNFLVYVQILLLLTLFGLGLQKTYEKGFVEGMMVFCDDDLGYDMVNDEYVCYNKTDYYHVNEFDMNYFINENVVYE